MSFNLYYSNHLDTLQYIAGYLTKVDPQPTPFDKEYFLVQNFGMARWMQIKLAKQLGILTQAEFLLPSKMLMNLIDMLFTEEEKAQAPIERLSKDQLFWPLVKIIDEIMTQESTDNEREAVLFTPIRDYLEKYEKDSASKKTQNPLLGILHLAENLAGIFDKYIVYRSSWVNAWSQGEMAPPYFDNTLPVELEKWQASLFQKLYDALGRPHHLGMLHPIIEAKLQDPSIIEKLPKRIFIIGLNSLPPLFLDLISQFSKVMDIHLFFNNPSQYYWGDLIKGSNMPNIDLFNFFEQKLSEIDPISPHIPESLRDSLDEHWQNSYGNPLLASLGKVGRDHLHLLQQYDGQLDLQITEAFSEPEVSNLLTKIQSEIYHLRPTRETEKYLVEEKDRSIQLHVTYSPMREVEALYNQLLRELSENPALEPEDIVVMTPDIELYAPFIHAVFGSAPRDRYLPYSISDVSIQETETIFTALIQLLSLPSSAFKASDLLMLIQIPEIMETFHFEESDLSLIHFWIHDANIKQAIDGEHLTEALQVPYDEKFDWDINTWRWGLQRMLLGYGTETESLPLQDDSIEPHTLLPYAHIEGKNAEILGNLCHFIDLLVETKTLLEGDKTASEWLSVLPKVWQKFFTNTSHNNDKLHFTQKLWQNLLEGAETVAFNKALPLKALTPMLEAKLLEEKPEQNFIQGKITFCSFIPMRTIPFKIIAMIGLNQADFPKSSIHHGFDLMQYQRMRGDRNRNTDDRYLFLEALLSAKESLYLSYIGKSIRDNSDLFPSLLIDELLRYIDQIAITNDPKIPASRAITYEHPMASYNEALFEDQSDIQSYQSEWILNDAVHQFYNSPYSYESLIHYFEEAEKITPTTDISLDSLIRFYQDPTTFFAENRLSLSPIKEHTTLIEDDELFSINKGLDEYQFNKALTETLLRTYLQEAPKNTLVNERSNAGIHSKTDLIERAENVKDAENSEELSPTFEQLNTLSDKLYEEYRLLGDLPKFAYGRLTWQIKSEFPKMLSNALIEAKLPLGEFEVKRFKSGITLHGKVPALSRNNTIILWDVGSLNLRRIIKASITNIFYHATKKNDDLATNLYLYHQGKGDVGSAMFPYYTKEDATKYLKHLINGYLYGISAPIPYLVSASNGKECFDNEFFEDILIQVRETLPELTNLPLEAWHPETFRTILKDRTYINSLPETIRKELNKVKSQLIGNNSFNRLFPEFKDKEVLAFILFYNHYLEELMPYEQQ